MVIYITEILDNNCRIVFFSDISTAHLRHVRSVLSFSDLVPEVVASFKAGARKPSSAMYEYMEQHICGHSVPFFYADDLPDNIEAAKNRDWPAFQFTSVQQCRQDFLNTLKQS